MWDPQPLGDPSAPALLRGELTAPGDHRVSTREYDVTVHVNQHGFVDREWGAKERPRVVVLGDSFVQAAQVTPGEGYTRRLEAALGGRAEVLAMGVPGAGTGTALGLLREQAFDLDPDVVVLGFLLANDVYNNHPALDDKHDKPFYRLDGGALVALDPRRAELPLPWLWDRSEAFRALVRTLGAREEVKRRLSTPDGAPLDLHVYAPPGDPTWEEAWSVTGALLRAMAEACAARGVGFGVVLFPDAVGGTPAGWTAAVARWPVVAGWDVAGARRRVAGLAGPAPVLDLFPVFEAAPAAPPLHFAADGHWTPAGHSLAAAQSVAFVTDLLEARRAGER